MSSTASFPTTFQSPDVPSLTLVGLSPCADMAYRCLVDTGRQGVAGLSRTLGFPVRDIRHALAELTDIGAVTATARSARSAGTDRTWSAQSTVTVAAGVHRMRRDMAVAWHRRHQQLAKLTDLGLSTTAPQAKLIPTATRTQARVLELVRRERTEHLVMNPDIAITEQAVRVASPVHKMLVDGKIAIREVGVPAAPDDATDALAAELAAHGALFRELPSVPAKMMIFDRTTALVRLDPENPQLGVVEIADPPSVAALVELFHRYWRKARDYRARNIMDLSAREQDIVRLLVAGYTDVDTASELGVSVRTVGYAIRELMDRFGVRNRFQLGYVLRPVIGPPGQPDDPMWSDHVRKEE